MFVVLFRLTWLMYVFSVLCSLETKAQRLPCGTPTDTPNQILSRDKQILELKKRLINARVSAAPTYLPIKAHIVRRTDATGGLSLADLNVGLARLNQEFANANIQFYLCGSTPNYINNNTYYNFNNADESVLCSANDVSNAINIYFTETIASGGTPVSGYAYFPDNSTVTNRIFIRSNTVLDNRTFAHEMGHYFNLLHTFQASNGPIANRELVVQPPNSSVNCATKGDFLCDTPADPYGRSPDSVKLLGCSYIGTVRDAQGQLFTPLLSNIMSYYPTNCGNDFTSGQHGRMADGLALRLDAANQYNLNCSSTVVGGNVPSNVNATINSSGITITFNDNSSNETGFIIERSTTSPVDDFVAIGGVAPNIASFLDQTTTAFTQYYYRVRASNSVVYSAVFSITTTLNYCLPLYQNSCASPAVIIDDFVLAPNVGPNIIQTTETGCSVDNYGNFTSVAYNVAAGQTYTFTARAVRPSGSSFFNQHIAIWLDYDRDGIFESTEMVYQSDGTLPKPSMSPTATGFITIPNTLAPGIVRLRIRSGFEGFGQITDPCAMLQFGEAHDYHLNIQAPVSFITTGQMPLNSVCAGQAVSVNFTTNLSGETYKAQLSDATGDNFVPIVGSIGTNSPLTATIPANTPTGSGYKIRVISSNPNATSTASNAFNITATPSPPSVASSLGYCSGQTTTALIATGSNLKWYTTASGGVGSASAPLPSNAVSSSHWVSQTTNSCESSRAKIDVNITTTPSTPSVASPLGYCSGQTTTALTATGSNLKWYTAASGGTGSASAPLPSNAVSSSHWVSQTTNSCESSRAKIDVNITTTPSAPSVISTINYTQNQTATALTATGSNLKWYTAASGGTDSNIAPTPQTTSIGTTFSYVSQTVNNCESTRAAIQINVNAPATASVCFNVKVFLEGALSAGTMTKNLNQQGLLPGQTPASQFGIPTPAGQPYNKSPWNYGGTETVNAYPANAVDWVLVSLRTSPNSQVSTVFRTAALLLQNGTVSLVSACPVLNISQVYHVVVEHRNHIGAVSHQAVAVNNNAISYDFTTQQSFIPVGSPANGQQQLGAIYALFAGDSDKNSFSQIDANDKGMWRTDNGKIGRYLSTDYNLDGAPDATDNAIWRVNNGKFSAINF